MKIVLKFNDLTNTSLITFVGKVWLELKITEGLKMNITLWCYWVWDKLDEIGQTKRIIYGYLSLVL